ncbi:MAG: AAA family ATPase, partial [Actinomycetota bacterium]|nr:AAA family ATPase [Actinomycetota bacterium]
YEEHHKVTITDDALITAAQLADRYISDRFLPDKAIDLVDEAASKVRMKRMTLPPETLKIEEDLHILRREKEAAIAVQDFEKAAMIRDKERSIELELSSKDSTWEALTDIPSATVTDEQIADVVSTWTGIPVFRLTEEETSKLLRMEDELHKRIVSQDEAIKAISRTIRRTRAGLKDPKRPSGSFIFLGPSGVGKTELAKALAEFLFGNESALIQLDMSEYMEKHTVSRMVGSPPGYVGYDEGGQLTERVRRHPYSVILLDEIEKAHPDVFNILLQILEDGRLTDAQGRTVDFKNTILIMTSNLGARFIQKGTSVGFGKSQEGLAYEDMKNKVMSEIKKTFRPEFLNRIDEIIVFHELSKGDIKQIIDIMFKRIAEQLREQAIEVELTDEAKDVLVAEGYEPAMGARPLRRAIQRLIEDPISEALLSGYFKAGNKIVISAKDGKLDFRRLEPAKIGTAGGHEA